MRNENENSTMKEIRHLIDLYGFRVSEDGRVYANRKPTRKQSEFIEAHKEEFLAELRRRREEEVRNMRIEFTEYEKEHRLNVIDLGDQGEFYGEYLVPGLRRVYGYWYATEEAIEQLREDGWEIEEELEPIWASIDYYISNERTEQREKDFLKDETACAFLFLELDWDGKDVYVESQEDAE